jgi:hypothetical protein
LPRSNELYFALESVLLVTVLYVWIAQSGIPRPDGWLGHGLGVLGFLLMLSTEILYSLRKRAEGVAWGRMSTWLQVHVFTGLFGSFLVLLHSSWRLNGLAGVIMLLTMVIVASGFVGRYIYTAVPHAADGAELSLRDVEAQIAAANDDVQAWAASHPDAAATLGERLTILIAEQALGGGAATVLGRTLLHWRHQRRLRTELRELNTAGQRRAALELQGLLDRRYRLQVQARSLPAARRLLALWRPSHVELGVALFTLTFIHIGVALYFATLAR